MAGTQAGRKYSPLDQINKKNVRQFKPLWIFDTGDFSDGKQLAGRSAFETTPLVIDGVMYVSTHFIGCSRSIPRQELFFGSSIRSSIAPHASRCIRVEVSRTGSAARVSESCLRTSREDCFRLTRRRASRSRFRK